MAIFVDPPAWPAHGRLWAHLVSDESLDELHAFAAANGVPRRGFERDHYDVPAELYDALVAAGAAPVSSREVIRRLHAAGLRRRKKAMMARRSVGRELLRPPRLMAGDLVAVVATAGVVAPERLAVGVARLESWGLRVRVADHVLARDDGLDYLAGRDADRAADFASAFSDPEVAGIVVARGGFGTQRIVDLLDWRRLAESAPKAVVGFSDVTALHQALASRLGLVSVLGHVATSLGGADDAGADQLRRLLMGDETVLDVFGGSGVETVVAGAADGVLVGGNLAVLAADVGTSTSRPAGGGIAVLEDVGEQPYRLDRALTQLARSGWLDDVRGVVCGQFTDCGDPAQIREVLLRRLAPLGVPLVLGAVIGHVGDSVSVPLGTMATLDASAPSLVLHRPALSP